MTDSIAALFGPTKPPRAPKHLRKAGRGLWRDVVNDHVLDRTQLVVLAAACEALDRATDARELVDLEGLTVTSGSGAIRAHPAVVIERDAREQYARRLRELGLSRDQRNGAARTAAARARRWKSGA